MQTENLTRRFGDFTAVDGVDLRIEKQDVFGFLGPNGSGKTTVIKMITGLLPASEGRAWVEGYDIEEDPDAVRARIGYMSQKFSLYNDLTVMENLEFYGRVYGLKRERLRSRIDAAVQLNHLQPFLSRPAGKLSGGWKQRLALSCAMLHEPRVMFLDEPTAGIDPVARRELWDLIFQLSSEGITFFVTTHYMDEAERCNRLAYIYNSVVIARGTPEQLRSLPEANPRGAKRIEFRTSEISRALHELRHIPEMRDATAFGQTVHALVDDSFDLKEIEHCLSSRGIDAADIREIAPSLEDVFVELTNLRRRELEGNNGQRV
ncbi:MAG: ABC transporter ATP-binding protein [Acidobacteriaceae bacterium]|nr:ABC transporter ATP-binding protein [Acidobacteriaceae bacterium]